MPRHIVLRLEKYASFDKE